MAESMESRKEKIFADLKEFKVVIARVFYDGSGDNGSIQHCEFFDKKSDEMSIPKDAPVYNELFELSSDLLSDAPFDWCNNEGGFGNVCFDVKKKTVKFEHNARFESTDYKEYKT